jgi:hypothetical protein
VVDLSYFPYIPSIHGRYHGAVKLMGAIVVSSVIIMSVPLFQSHTVASTPYECGIGNT